MSYEAAARGTRHEGCEGCEGGRELERRMPAGPGSRASQHATDQQPAANTLTLLTGPAGGSRPKYQSPSMIIPCIPREAINAIYFIQLACMRTEP